jgi:hypothetical protein
VPSAHRGTLAARAGLVLAGLAIAAVAVAQEVVLHELVPNLGADEGSSLVSSRGAEPAAIVYGGELLRAPEGGPLRSDERAMEPTPGDGQEREEEGRRSPTFQPDRVTALHGSIPYFEVFTPAITPYKRVTSLDEVRLDASGVPYLAVSSGPRERVPVEGPGVRAPDARERDRFWGSVVLDFTQGREVPLPSVSPESRILSLRTEPDTALHVERDGAGNFVAVLEEGVAANEVRVVLLTDAPRTFFGFDEGQGWPDAPSDALAEELSPLPARTARDAQELLAELGLHRGMPFELAMDGLVRHFRSFVESEEPPADTGNVYLDLARGMRGVCRHRAYAFVISAQALGIAARFVSNEAHAWVEVHLPERRGWMRIDLGGSAQGLSPRNADTGPAYQPAVADPLPRPAEYTRALAEAARQSRATGTGADRSAGGGTAGGSSGGSGGGANGQPAMDDPAMGDPAMGDPAMDDPGAGPTAAPAEPPRAPLALRLEQHSAEVLRGQSIEVSGAATSATGPAPDLRVEVLLRDPDGSERLLGVTVTDANGLFHGTFGVPPETRVGEHALVVRSPGDERLSAAVAQ